jgi:hypothetical protein
VSYDPTRELYRDIMRIPVKPDAYSKVKPDTYSDFIPDSVPI